MLRSAAAFVVLLSLTGCSASYQRQDTGGMELHEAGLDKARPVLVAIPADGSYQSKAYPGSGVTVAQQTAVAFAKHARKVDTAAPNLTDKEALLGAARKDGFGYLVIPTITHWEHRATEWSGIPSRASVALTIIDVQTGDKVRSSQLDARSRIISWTSTSPDSLSRDMLLSYVEGLYGHPQAGQP